VQDSFLARYGCQDIHKIRGLTRSLTVREKLLFEACIAKHMAKEFTVPTPGGGSNS